MSEEVYADFWSHIKELRSTLLKILFTILIGIAVSFAAYQPLLAFLTAPLKAYSESSSGMIEERFEQVRIINSSGERSPFTLPPDALPPAYLSKGIIQADSETYWLEPGASFIYSKKQDPMPLVVLGPLEGMLTALKTSLWIGCVATSPAWLLFLLQFVAPGLQSHEKRLVIPFIIASLAFMLAGCAFAYFLTIPIANLYLKAFNEGIAANLWALGPYLEYTFFLLLANALGFECAVLGIFAVNLGLVSAESLASKRRAAILGAFILAALLTPPDVLTQFLLAVPLLVLYEGLILYARFKTNLSSKI